MLRGMMKPTIALLALVRATTAFACPGDCNGDGHVTIDELTLAVTIARQGARVSACPSLDVDGGGVSTAEVESAVEVALTGCPFVGEFHSTVILNGGRSGVLSMTVDSTGAATATLTIADTGAGAGGAAAAPSLISLSGSVDLDTGTFSLSGSFDDGQGHVVDVSIGGALPLPLGGGGTINFQIGPDGYTSSIVPGSAPEPTATATVTPTPKGAVHVILVGGPGESVFSPEFLAIDVGDTIEWQFVGGSHSVVSSSYNGLGLPTCNPSGAFASDVLSSGTFRHTFDVAGDFDYHCGVPGHCEVFESAAIQVIGPPSPTPTPTPTLFPTLTATPTPATIDGVSVDMIGTFTGKATAQSTQFMFDASVRIGAGSGAVTATDVGNTVFPFLGSISMTVIDPTHLSYHQLGIPEITLTLTLSSPGHIDGVFTVVNPGMPSTPVLLSLDGPS